MQSKKKYKKLKTWKLEDDRLMKAIKVEVERK